MNHIYITGLDGCGKTTQIDRIQARLQARGERVQRVWIRFPCLTSAPLLIYARLRGYTRYEVTHGVRTGGWFFEDSWLLRTLFPWTQLLDVAILASIQLFPALLMGRRIIFERYALDVLADLMSATGRSNLHRTWVGRALRGCVPAKTTCILLRVSIDLVRQRRPHLAFEPQLAERFAAYRTLEEAGALAAVDGSADIDHVARVIATRIEAVQTAGCA